MLLLNCDVYCLPLAAREDLRGVEGGEQFSFGSEALTSVAPRPFGPRLPQVSCEIHIVPLPVGESQAEASAKKSARRGPGGGVVGCTKLIVDDRSCALPFLDAPSYCCCRHSFALSHSSRTPSHPPLTLSDSPWHQRTSGRFPRPMAKKCKCRSQPHHHWNSYPRAQGTTSGIRPDAPP